MQTELFLHGKRNPKDNSVAPFFGTHLKKSHWPAAAALAQRCEVRRGELLIYQMAPGCSVKCSEKSLGKRLGARDAATVTPGSAAAPPRPAPALGTCMCVLGRVSGICA